MMALQPAVRTSVRGEGRVTARDVTRFQLHRMRVEMEAKYPDLEVWLRMLPATARPLLYRYEERVNNHVFVGSLWLYWKEEA